MKYFCGLLLTVIIATGCQHPGCVNTNTILNTKTSSSTEYQDELAKLIDSSEKENIVYSFDSYKELNGREFIVVNLQGKNFCGTTDFAVNDWTKIKALKGEGYRGAELKGFQYDIVDNPKGKSFVYKDLDAIVD